MAEHQRNSTPVGDSDSLHAQARVIVSLKADVVMRE